MAEIVILQSSPFTQPKVRSRLQLCANDHAQNIHERKDPRGDHVTAIHEALAAIVPNHGISKEELDQGVYGEGTRKAVLRFKSDPILNGTKGKILGPGQSAPDSIVGKQTILALDIQLRKLPGPEVPIPPLPPPAGIFDILVRIMGQDPRAGIAGKPDAGGQGEVFAPTVIKLAEKINTSQYLTTHQPIGIINFNGGGGQANLSSDPTKEIMKAVKAFRSVSQPGQVIVIGWSSGGRNAATLTRMLSEEKIPVSYLAIIDAAFDNEADAERTKGVKADIAENFFEAVSNELLEKDLPGNEFHGEVTGCNTNLIFDSRPFFQEELRKYREEKQSILDDDLGRKEQRIKPVANAFFSRVHRQAVIDGYRSAEAKAIRLLHGALKSRPDLERARGRGLGATR